MSLIKENIRIKLRERLTGILTEISSNDAWTKIYSDKAKFPLLNGDVNLFNALNNLIPNSDANFNKGVFTWLYNLKKANKLKDEDFYKVKEYLDLFNKFINKIPKENRDLMKLKSLSDLYDIIKPFAEDSNQATSKSQELKNIKQNEVRKVFEDGDYLIQIPLTERASCLIGKGTQWCTAADKSDNMFDHYNKTGHLYVITKKDDNSKYQIHFESNSLMDEKDRAISGIDFFEHVDDGTLESFFRSETPKFWEFILETSVDDVVEYGTYSELFNTAINKIENPSVKDDILNQLRDSSNNEAIYIGFMEEDDSDNITKYQINELADYNDENENLENIIDHLVKIGYDFGTVDNVDLSSFIAGKELLNDYKLELDVPYKIDKGRTLKILKINFKQLFPTHCCRQWNVNSFFKSTPDSLI